MSSTSAEALSIQAVSPRSIFDPAGAGEAGAAGAALLGGAAGCWARTALAGAPSTSSVSRARVSRFTRISLGCRRRAPRPAVGESKRGLISLARADADRRLHRRHEDLAVADVAGLGRGRHDLGHLVHELVGYDDLDLDLREEVHGVLAAPVQLRVALLPAETAHLGDGHADHADAGERFLDVVQLERLDDRLDFLHHGAPLVDVRAMAVPPPSPAACWRDSGRSASVISLPRATSTARSSACCSSRTLPGHEYDSRRRYASGSMASAPRWCLAR